MTRFVLRTLFCSTAALALLGCGNAPDWAEELRSIGAHAPGGAHEKPPSEPVCEEGISQCVVSLLETCSEGTWATVEKCASPALCDPYGCSPPSCFAGEYHCEGSTLKGCNRDLTGFDILQVCESAALCDVALNGHPPVCRAAADVGTEVSKP